MGPDSFDCACLVWYVYNQIFDINIFELGFGLSTTTKILTSTYGKIMLFNKLDKNKNISLINLRYDFINKINKELSTVFNNISNMGELVIKYKSFISENDLKRSELRDFLIKRYNSLLTNEILQKTTLLGCHKDDFKLYINDLDVTEFCSQGQQRLSILSLKLAEIEVFIKEKNIKPIILLDDIFSELDEQ